jgi:hypothetical protein
MTFAVASFLSPARKFGFKTKIGSKSKLAKSLFFWGLIQKWIDEKAQLIIYSSSTSLGTLI